MALPAWVRFGVLILAAVASGLLLSGLEGDHDAEPPRARLVAGYYLDDAELVGTGDDGRVLYRVSTRRALESLDDGGVNLEDVRVSYAPQSDVPWDLTAEAGHIPPDGKILQLMGNVVAITREGARAPATIRTDSLELNPDTYVASTDDKVVIEYSGNEIFATGLRVFLKEDRVQLISNVNGKFLP